MKINAPLFLWIFQKTNIPKTNEQKRINNAYTHRERSMITSCKRFLSSIHCKREWECVAETFSIQSLWFSNSDKNSKQTLCSYFMVREIEGIKMNWQTKDRMNKKKRVKKKRNHAKKRREKERNCKENKRKDNTGKKWAQKQKKECVSEDERERENDRNIFSEIIKNRFRHTNKWIKYNWATNTTYTVSCNAKKVILKLKTPLDHLTIKKKCKEKASNFYLLKFNRTIELFKSIYIWREKQI